VLERVEAELVQERSQRDMRVVRHGVPQRQRPIRRQFAHQPVGQRLDGIVLILLRLGLAADGDDGALHGRCGRQAAIVPITIGLRFAIAVHGNRRLVFGPDIAAIDRKAAVCIDADEDARTDDLGRIEDARPGLEGGERRLDFAKARIRLLGQLVGVLVLGFELGVLPCNASIVACSSAVRSVGVPSSSRR
jgi:hypothetical protein